jgi:glutamine synthetase
MEHRIDPGPETTGNGYAKAPDAPPIPIDWRSAIVAAQESEFLKAALGDEMHRTFTAIKSAEYARVARTVTEIDYDLYLHTI